MRTSFTTTAAERETETRGFESDCRKDDDGEDAAGAETEAAHNHQSSGSQSPNHSSGSTAAGTGEGAEQREHKPRGLDRTLGATA